MSLTVEPESVCCRRWDEESTEGRETLTQPNLVGQGRGPRDVGHLPEMEQPSHGGAEGRPPTPVLWQSKAGPLDFGCFSLLPPPMEAPRCDSRSLGACERPQAFLTAQVVMSRWQFVLIRTVSSLSPCPESPPSPPSDTIAFRRGRWRGPEWSLSITG